MPSQHELSGLNQRYSLHSGIVPIVRRTGGLADTIVDAAREATARNVATGCVVEPHTPDAFLGTAERAYSRSGIWRDGGPIPHIHVRA